MINVLEYLEESNSNYGDKVAVVDDRQSCTYRELTQRAKEIGTYISNVSEVRKPIAVFMDKSVTTLQTFMGIIYAGCFYTLIDPSFPVQRIKQILSVLETDTVITIEKNIEKLKESGFDKSIIDIDKVDVEVDEEKLIQIRQQAIDTDPIYCNFTSGSTGVPKGVLICHRSVLDFIDNFTQIFNITNKDVIGNQAPFDFDVSVKDIFSCLKTGATLVIIPKAYFMFPTKVVEMLDENKVTTLIWAVSALVMLNRLHGLKHRVPSCINKIMFSGEMMPIKQLNQWRKYYKDAMFVNLYGPTEITCNCTYYILDREFEIDEKLPMGQAFPNEKVFLLDDNDNEVTSDKPNVPAEVCVAGTALALGYYNNPETTKKAFTVNPLNNKYRERIYRTGDLAYYGEDGKLYFAGRKDFQIKHMGHRIELEEIETALGNVSVVEQACCFFDTERNKVVAFYVGDEDKRKIIDEMKQKVPEYMIPNIFKCVDKMPLNKNGKTDRALLKKIYSER